MERLSRKDHVRPKLKAFWRAKSGAAALEYAVIAAFLSVAIVVSVQNVGITVRDDLFVRVQNALASAVFPGEEKRTIAADEAADPIITGSTPKE